MVLIIFVSGILMLRAAKEDSAIVDELAHIPAGYANVRYLDYRLNPEHPPVVKAIAALPLLFQQVTFPTDSPAWTTDVNGQWTIGRQFLYESGNDADRMIYAARIGPIILTLLTVLLLYFWAASVVGRWWALLPAFLFAFSPTVLAHGHYVTTDIGATLGVLLATATFIWFLGQPSRTRLVVAGLAFGVAQLLKFSMALLVPYFVLLLVVFYLAGVWRDWASTESGGRWRRFSIRAWHYGRSLFIIFIIGGAVIYVVYFLFTLGYSMERQVFDTKAILGDGAIVWMAGNPIFRPLAQYLLGLLMVVQRAVDGNTLYFLGEVTNVGYRSYFPLVFLMKEPLASLLLILGALALGVWGFLKGVAVCLFKKFQPLAEYLNTHFAEFAMILFVGIYWAYSIKSNLNIGVRHLLPTFPFIYVLTTNAIRSWFGIEELGKIRNFVIQILVLTRSFFGISIKAAILSALLLWYFLSSILSYPYFLSYFNIAVGGTNNGYRRVVDSNYDWGQDLKRLQAWVTANLPDDERIAVDYFGGGSPFYYLGEQAEPWWSSKGTPVETGIHWLAVSVNSLQVAKDEYSWLENPYQPYARVGTSIFVYKLD